MTFRNTLTTGTLVAGSDKWAALESKAVARRTVEIAAAEAAGQLVYVSGDPDKGDSTILGEVVGTGVEQSIAHGLGQVPSAVAPCVSYDPDTGYGGGSGKPFEITFGAHTATHIKVTCTTGVKFYLAVEK